MYIIIHTYQFTPLIPHSLMISIYHLLYIWDNHIHIEFTSYQSNHTPSSKARYFEDVAYRYIICIPVTHSPSKSSLPLNIIRNLSFINFAWCIPVAKSHKNYVYFLLFEWSISWFQCMLSIENIIWCIILYITHIILNMPLLLFNQIMTTKYHTYNTVTHIFRFYLPPNP